MVMPQARQVAGNLAGMILRNGDLAPSDRSAEIARLRERVRDLEADLAAERRARDRAVREAIAAVERRHRAHTARTHGGRLLSILEGGS